MKYISSAALFLFLLTAIACGQSRTGNVRISAKDSTTLAWFEKKSMGYQNTRPDSSIYYANLGLKLSARLQYKPAEARILGQLSRTNEQYGNIAIALKYQQQACDIYKSLPETESRLQSIACLGILEVKQGDFTRGKNLIESVLPAYQKKHDTAALIKTYIQLGEIHELNGKTDTALHYYAMAEQLSADRPLTDDYFLLINSIGGLHSKQGNHNHAVRYYEAGIDKSGAQPDPKMQIALLNKAGKTWHQLGDKQKALEYHRKSLELSQQSGFQEEAARSLMGIAGTLSATDADQSILHLKNALAIANSIGQKQLIVEIYNSLANIYKQQARYQDAIMALEAHHHLLDSITIANKGHKIAVLQSSYELSESKLRVESLELANRIKTNQRNIVVLIALAALIIAGVLTVYFRKTSRLNRRLKEANQVKDKLFSIIGHDLRNPIGGTAQLLRFMETSDLDAAKQKQMITTMRKQSDATLEILTTLLQWGQTQLKGVTVQPTTFHAKGVIEKNIQALQQQAASKSVMVSQYIPDEMLLTGDENHFDFIIRNLLSNAIKFSYPSGTIEVGAAYQQEHEGIVFSVTDHGKGISRQQQELFMRSNLDVSYGTKGEKGTGIGLMLGKEFIRANNGKLWLKSEEGKGTTFYFSFPRMASSLQ